jgi:hypothetical protein
MTTPFDILAVRLFPFGPFSPYGGHFGRFGLFPFTPLLCISIIALVIIVSGRRYCGNIMNTNRRDTGIAYLLLLFGGFIGLHKFYLNRPGWGVAYIFTGGMFGIGLICDLFTLPAQVQRCNQELGAAAAAPQGQPSPFASSAEAFARASARVDAFARRLDDLETVIFAQRRK